MTISKEAFDIVSSAMMSIGLTKIASDKPCALEYPDDLELTLETLGVDWAYLLDLIFALEDALECDIEGEIAETWLTVYDIALFAERKLNGV